MSRASAIEAMGKKEWKAMYAEWRKPYAHLPPEVRGHAVRGCAGKIGYPTEAEAVEVAATLPPREGKRLSTYSCVICKMFHIGNTRYPESHRIFKMPPPQETA